jgi:hypothetical protein
VIGAACPAATDANRNSAATAKRCFMNGSLLANWSGDAEGRFPFELGDAHE